MNNKKNMNVINITSNMSIEKNLKYYDHLIIITMRNIVNIVNIIKNTRRYGLLCGPNSSSCVGLQPSTKAFFPSGKKKNLLYCFGSFKAIFATLAYF